MRKFLKIFFAISVLTLTFKVDWYYNDEYYNNTVDYLNKQTEYLRKQKSEIEEINRVQSARCYQTNYQKCSSPIYTSNIENEINRLEREIDNLRYNRNNNIFIETYLNNKNNNYLEDLRSIDKIAEEKIRAIEEEYKRREEELKREEENFRIQEKLRQEAPFRNELEKIYDNFIQKTKKDLENITLSELEKFLKDFEYNLKSITIYEKDYNRFLDEIKYKIYLKKWNKMNFQNIDEWKKFLKIFENIKNNKEKIFDQFKTVEKYIKSFNLDRAINNAKGICVTIKLFECEYNIAKIYKTEMIWYSESYHSSNKEENFLKNKQEAIKYLENAINSYKKDLFLDEIDISKIEKELEEVKNYKFKWNKQEKNLVKNEEVKKEENKVVKLFFERLEKMTKNYSEVQKKNLYNLLITKIKELKIKNIPTEIRNSLDEIILKLRKM